MTDTIKKGTVLWAIDPCEIDGKPTLTIGKSYEVGVGSDGAFGLAVIDDRRKVTPFHDWQKFFSLTPPEDNQMKPMTGKALEALNKAADQAFTPTEDKGVQTEGKSGRPVLWRFMNDEAVRGGFKNWMDVIDSGTDAITVGGILEQAALKYGVAIEIWVESRR